MTTPTPYDVLAEEATLRLWADAYYNEQPVVTDAVFDAKLRKHREMRPLMADQYPLDTILDTVGAAPRGDSPLTTLKHEVPMLSLDNVFEEEDGTSPGMLKWLNDVAIDGPVVITAESKHDGASLALIYINGILEKGITRGDGNEGEDVLSNVVAGDLAPLSIIPGHLPRDGAGTSDDVAGVTYEVRGEVVMTFAQFEKINADQRAKGEKEYANPRNAASGALRRHDPAASAAAGLKFIAYSVVRGSHETTKSQEHAMIHLHSLGFNVGDCHKFLSNQPPSVSTLKRLLCDNVGHPTDGVVLKVDFLPYQARLGSTSRAPRWGVALKFQQERALTPLTAITVQVGRSGVLTPVAELVPVLLDGSTVSRATLHNEDQVRRLGIQVGDVVVVRKAGAIIPEIVESETLRLRKEELLQYFQTKYPENAAFVNDDAVAKGIELERAPFDLLQHIGGKCPSCKGTDIQRVAAGRSVGKDFRKLTAEDVQESTDACRDMHPMLSFTKADAPPWPDEAFAVHMVSMGGDAAGPNRNGDIIAPGALKDPHVAMAMKLYGVTAEQVTAEMRSDAKTVNFGCVGYGPAIEGSPAWQKIEEVRERCKMTPDAFQAVVTEVRRGAQIITQQHLVKVAAKATVAYRCMNPNCPAQLSARIEHLCSRKCLDIDGIGGEASDAMAKAIIASCDADVAVFGCGDGYPTALELLTCVFSFESTVGCAEKRVEMLAALTWTTESGGTMTFGESRARKAVESLLSARNLPLHRWLFALGIPTVGENTSKEISRLCEDMAQVLREATVAEGIFTLIGSGVDKDTDERLKKFEISSHIGPSTASALCDFVRTDGFLNVVDILCGRKPSWGVVIKSDNYSPIRAKVQTNSALCGKTVVVTGTLSVSRDEMHDLLTKAGAVIGKSVSKKTHYLVAGADCGSKLTKAKAAGVTILTEAEARAML